jgi:hypothetical protein
MDRLQGGRRAPSASRRPSIDLSVDAAAPPPPAGPPAFARMSPSMSLASIRSQLAEARARTESLQRMRGAR